MDEQVSNLVKCPYFIDDVMVLSMTNKWNFDEESAESWRSDLCR